MKQTTALFFTVQLLTMLVPPATGNRQYILTHERACYSNDITLVCKSPQNYQVTSVTIMRELSEDSNSAIVVATNVTEYSFTITPEDEGFYFCVNPVDSSTTSNRVPLLCNPERNPDTRDYYAHQVGTQQIDIDCGITVGVLAMYYDDIYWNRGNNVLRASDDDPRVTVHSQNFSLSIMDSRLADGQTYICYVEVNGKGVEQMVTLLSYTTPRITPTENITVAVPRGGKENATLTCSMEVQTGSDTLESVTVRWTHNGETAETTENARHTVHTGTVLDRAKGYVDVESTLTVHDLELSSSGSVLCHVSITTITAQDGNLRTLHLSSTALLFVISDELTVQVDPVLGGVELCVTNLPIPLPGINQGRLVIKLTAVDDQGSEPNQDTFTELTTPYGSLTMFTKSSICYTLADEDTRGLLPSRYARVQVALRHRDVIGPYIPLLRNATEIELTPGPSHSDTWPTKEDAILLIGIGLAFLLALGLAITTTVSCYLCHRPPKSAQTRVGAESNC